ncbi:MAG: RNA polymerase sigma factor [Phycisphaerales bacterium]
MTALPVHLVHLAPQAPVVSARMTPARPDPHPTAAATAAGATSTSRTRPIPTAGAAVDDALAAQWSAGVARGDHDALDALYRNWFDRGFAVAKALTRRDEAFCLDVVQNAMLRIIRTLKPLASRAALDAYMHATLRSAALDALRAEARRAVRNARAARADSATDRSPAQLEDLASALAALGVSDRELLTLRFARDQTLEQTGTLTGRTGAAAHGLIRRALRKLRASLDPRDVEKNP